jgi:poly-gamma-glutamate capsule biosynthesis protein CapA/YwtB (metallophosphatase superfamily)
MKIAIAGDAIITRPVSQLSDPRAAAIFDVLRNADLAFMNCETVLHDYDGPGVFPSAEAGLVAMRSPTTIAAELKWLNARLLGMANNHSLDYSFGGLASTHAALTEAGISYAGTGDNLAQARGAAYIDLAEARIALVSMSSSATKESRASEPFDGVQARPGLNPLGYHFAADRQTIDKIVELSSSLGLWVAQITPEMWEVNPPGLHNTITRYYLSDKPGCRMILDEEDVAANLRSIRNAKADADIVIVHVHNHEWDTVSGSLRVPPDFMKDFARAAIDAGGDIVVAQGSHAPFRGIELYKGKPIFYDPGDFFLMANTITRHSREFYARHAVGMAVPIEHALPVDGNKAIHAYAKPLAPAGGYFGGWEPTGAVIVLDYQEGKLAGIALHPFSREPFCGEPSAFPAVLSGVPLKPDTAQADDILRKFADLSQPFGTSIRIEDGIGYIAL